MTRPFRLVVNEPLQGHMDRETVEALRRVVRQLESENLSLKQANEELRTVVLEMADRGSRG